MARGGFAPFGPDQDIPDGPVHVRVECFFVWRGDLRGFVGAVEEPGHLFDGLLIVCYLRITGEHDLETNLCIDFGVELGAGPVLVNDGWPGFERRKTSFMGHGTVAASDEALEAWLAKKGIRHWLERDGAT